MPSVLALNEHIYNLLINRGFDNFTISELVIELERIDELRDSSIKLTKLAYRQVRLLKEKGFLCKCAEKRGRSNIYSKTSLFNVEQLEPKATQAKYRKVPCSTGRNKTGIDFWRTIAKEKNELETRKEIASREIEKYEDFLSRYPDFSDLIMPIYLDARSRAILIQGYLEAIGKLLVHHPSFRKNKV
ncbi:hypothetical protein [Pseudoalteromonas rubra]|uniref:hypothetical protein n=1 Tax=Pseudoalteromonas rubra TaxID=43658 RepID=UPI000F771A8F|nr:hypothetical protein [Pseudoalteromonas rubra]